MSPPQKAVPTTERKNGILRGTADKGCAPPQAGLKPAERSP